MATYTKDPAAVLDYAWDWTAWLANEETIVAHTVTPAEGITVSSTAEAAGVVTAWLSGGSVGASYALTCRVTTSQGRTDERTIRITVRER